MRNFLPQILPACLSREHGRACAIIASAGRASLARVSRKPGKVRGVCRWLSIALMALFPLVVSAATIKDINVRCPDVEIQNPDFVLAYISVKPGDQLEQRSISRDVDTLLASGRFSFVDAELTPGPDGYTLTYIVEIKPTLGQAVEISGANAMGQRRVLKWLDLETGDPVDNAIMAISSRKVLEEYNKRFYPDTKVTWTIDINPATGFASVKVTVEEGERASLREVRFEGNTYVPPSRFQQIIGGLIGRKLVQEKSVAPDVLRDAIKDQIWHLFSFITKRGIYDPDVLEMDRDVFKTIYQDNGYLDAQIGKPTVRAYEPHKLESTFPVMEGNQYRIGAVSLHGITLFPESNLWSMIRLATADVASMKAIRQTASDLQAYYQSRGYLRTSVKPVLSPHVSESVVDVLFDVTEGRLVNIRYIDIRGNTTTKDSVIRRELLIYPGQVYDQVRVKRSERILQNLGFFSSVTSYPRETLDPVKDDLVFDVTEQKTGQFLVGAGYSSIDEIIGFAELSQGNLDLFGWPYFTGGGQKIRLRAQLGTQRQDYEISFVEPWFLGRKLSLGVDLYDTTRDNLSDYYDQQRLGSAITLGQPIKGFFQRADFRYSLERITIFNVSTNAIQRIKDEEGDRTASTLRLTFIHDTRDNLFVPTRGNKTTVSGQFSGGPLGFDTDVYGFEAESTTYWPLWLNHVLSLRLWAEVIEEYGDDDDVPLFDRLFLGGARTLRGFKYRYVCPYEEGEPIGGKSGALASAEYTIPIPAVKILRFATFYELGNVWLDAYDFDLLNYCSDVGIGVRLDIPGFPVRLDYAWPLEISGDVTRTSARFNFLLGYGF